MYQRDLLADIGQIKCFFHRRIAATDHSDLTVTVEKPVTGGTGGNTAAIKCCLTFKAKPAGLSTCGDNHAVCGQCLAAIKGDGKRPFGKINIGDKFIFDACPDIFSLLLHLLHQPRPLNNIGKAGIVFNIGGDGELTAGLQPCQHKRVQIGTGSINRRGQTGSTSADNN